MSSQPVFIWGVFPDQAKAGAALNKLEEHGFLQSQIAIQKRFKAALMGFDWSHALYTRLPEGVVIGFVGGCFLAVLAAFILAKGVPPLLPLAFLVAFLSIAGTMIGGFLGFSYACIEPLFQKGNGISEDAISIGVRCSDLQSEVHAKQAFENSGAASIDATS